MKGKFLSVVILASSLLGAPTIAEQESFAGKIIGSYKVGNYWSLLQEIEKYSKHFDSGNPIDQNLRVIIAYIRGLVSFQERKFNSAIVNFSEALSLNTKLNNAEILYNLGACYYNLGHFEKSEQFFYKSLSENPEFVLSERGVTLSKLAKVSKEVMFVNNRIDCLTSDSILLGTLGLFYFYLDNNLQAINYFKRGIQSDSNNAFNYNGLGMVFESINNFDESIKWYKKGLEIQPQYTDMWNNMGISLYMKHDLSNAVECFKRASKLNYLYPNAYNNLGFVYIDYGRFSEAKTFFELASSNCIGNRSLSGEAQCGLSICNFMLSNYSEAYQNKSNSIRLLPMIQEKEYAIRQLRWSAVSTSIYFDLIK